MVVVASCHSSGGDIESRVSVFLCTRAHTPLKKKKKFAPIVRVTVVTRRVVTYGIRAGSTRDLGFATAFVDLSCFVYIIADRVDSVRAR
jgi:hypothetical protein